MTNMITRILDLEKKSFKKSLFLLGPRQTGKTTSLKLLQLETKALYINLLDPDDYLPLLNAPGKLKEIIRAYRFPDPTIKHVIIDEIQKIPILLDSVHLLIEEDKCLRFILTGSSARKLRLGGVNLLGGRASRQLFFPFTTKEWGVKNWKKIMLYGSLPPVVFSDEPFETLKDYVNLYLKEEIQAEALVRKMANFSRFLYTAAIVNGEQLNYEKVASDAQVSARTVKDYFQILEDTLIGWLLEPYRPNASRKFVSTPKFYFFDIGIVHALLGQKELKEKTIDFGKSLEHLIFCELNSYIHLVKGGDDSLYYWRTQTKMEVDFVVQTEQSLIAIEVKASDNINDRHLKGLKALNEECPLKKKIIITTEKRKRETEDEFTIYPVEVFLQELWDGDIF